MRRKLVTAVSIGSVLLLAVLISFAVVDEMSEEEFIDSLYSDLEIQEELNQGEQVNYTEVDPLLNRSEIRDYVNRSYVQEAYQVEDGVHLDFYYDGSSTPELGNPRKSAVIDDTLYVFVTRDVPIVQTMDMVPRGKGVLYENVSVDSVQVETVEYRDEHQTHIGPVEEAVTPRWNKTRQYLTTFDLN